MPDAGWAGSRCRAKAGRDGLKLGSGGLRPLLQEIQKNLRAKRYAAAP